MAAVRTPAAALFERSGPNPGCSRFRVDSTQKPMQHSRRSRLHHMMINAGLPRPPTILLMPQPSKGNDGRRSPLRQRPYPRRSLQPAQLRHTDIHEDHTGLKLPEQLQGLPRPISRMHVMPHQRKHERHSVRRISLIIHDQHLERNLGMRHVFHRSRPSPTRNSSN